MAGIRGRNTKPEMLVRSWIHRQGLRFRLHGKGLPGRPDLILPKYNVVIFVHGCFWHQHRGCRFAYSPKSNAAFWRSKLQGNVKRDAENTRRLRRLGWRVLTIWECDLSERGMSRLVQRVRQTKYTSSADRSGRRTL